MAELLLFSNDVLMSTLSYQVGCILRNICAESISASGYLEMNTQFKNRLGDENTYREKDLLQAVPEALFL